MIYSDPGDEQDFVHRGLYTGWELTQIIRNCHSRYELRKVCDTIMTYKSHFTLSALETGLDAVRLRQMQLKH